MAALLVGFPLSLLGVLLGSGHPGSGLFFVVVLVPSALLFTRELVPREYFWLLLPAVQFIYYFVIVSVVLAFVHLFRNAKKAKT